MACRTRRHWDPRRRRPARESARRRRGWCSWQCVSLACLATRLRVRHHHRALETADEHVDDVGAAARLAMVAKYADQFRRSNRAMIGTDEDVRDRTLQGDGFRDG